jgi:hypothetical protein
VAPGRFARWSSQRLPELHASVALLTFGTLALDALVWRSSPIVLVCNGIVGAMFGAIAVALYWQRSAQRRRARTLST